MAAEISSDVDSEAPGVDEDTSRRISQEVATEGMAAEISSDVDSEAPAETNIQVGVSRKKSQLRG